MARSERPAAADGPSPIRLAMVQRRREITARFPTERGNTATERDAAVILAGKALQLDTQTLFSALYAVGSPMADAFTSASDPKNQRRWLLTELDEIAELPRR